MPLTYGIDVHGTLAIRQGDEVASSSLYPLLVPLMRAWIAKGERVLVLSGPPIDIIRKELSRLGLCEGVHYSGILSMVDFLRGRGTKMWERPPESGHWWVSTEEWNAAKGLMAAEYQIDIVIDDTPGYGPAMPINTQFVLVEASLLRQPGPPDPA